MVSRQIEKAQRKVEQHNFDIRKNLLDFDDVANDQRKVIYEQRNELLESESVADTVADIRRDVFAALVQRHVPADSVDEQWDLVGLDAVLEGEYGIRLGLHAWAETHSDADPAAVLERVQQAAEHLFRDKEATVGADTMRALEKHVMLSVLDNAWKEHLASMDYLRQGIYLRGYAQVQPKQEFKRESFILFSAMLDRIKSEITQMLARVRVQSEAEVAAMEAEQQRLAARAALEFHHAEASGFAPEPVAGDAAALPAAVAAAMTPTVREGPKVGRNDPCPCGSGKKYKQCHGRLA